MDDFITTYYKQEALSPTGYYRCWNTIISSWYRWHGMFISCQYGRRGMLIVNYNKPTASYF